MDRVAAPGTTRSVVITPERPSDARPTAAGAPEPVAERFLDPNTTITLIVAVASITACFGPAAPTGLLVVDVLYRAAAAALITYAGSRAARWTWVTIAAASLAAAHEWWQIPAALSLAIAVWATFMPRTRRRVGALVAGLAVQGLLHWTPFAFQGAPTLFAVAACLPLLVSAYRRSPANVRRHARLASLAVIGAAVVLMLPFLVSVALARSQVDAGVQRIRAAFGIGGVTSSDPSGDLREASSSIGLAHTLISGPWNLGSRLVPVVGQQQQALSDAADVARALGDEASDSVGASQSDAMVLRDGRIDLDRLRSTSAALVDMQRTLRDVRVHHPRASDVSPWVIGPIRGLIGDLDLGGRARSTVASTLQSTRAMPSLLGGDGARRYLVVLIDPSVSRGLGGVARAYAHVTAEDGRIRVADTAPIDDLDGGRPVKLTGPPGYLARYGVYDPASHPGDVTYSPDLGDVADVLRQLDRTATRSRPLDGVIVLDPAAIRTILQTTTAPRGTKRTPLTAVEAQRQLSGGGSGAAADARYAKVLRSTLDLLVTGSMPAPSDLVRAFRPLVVGGHVMIHSSHRDDQHFLQEAGLSREVTRSETSGDVIGVTSQSVRGDGLDPYLQRSTTVATTYQLSTGDTSKKVTITLRNGAPRGTTRQWISLYTPDRAIGANTAGDYLPIRWSKEAGTSVYSVFLDVPAGKQRSVTFGLAGHLVAGSRYALQVFDQPGAAKSTTTVKIVAPYPYRPVRSVGAAVRGKRAVASVGHGHQREVSVGFVARRRGE